MQGKNKNKKTNYRAHFIQKSRHAKIEEIGFVCIVDLGGGGGGMIKHCTQSCDEIHSELII